MKNWWLGFSTTMIGLCIFIKYTLLMVWDKRNNRDPMKRLDTFRDAVFMHCYERLGITLKIEDNLGFIPNKPTITYGKHMDTMAIFCYYHSLRSTFPNRPIIVVAGKPKMKNLFGLVSRAVAAIDGIIIDREKPEEAIEVIKRKAQTFNEPPIFVIFPEGHRATKKRIKETHEYLKSIGRSDLIKSYPHTQAPRSRGTHALRSAIADPMCVRISCGFNVRNAYGTFSSHKLVNSEFLVQLEETELPTDAQELKTQLLEIDFPEMNRVVESHIGRREHADFLKSKAA